MDREERVLCAWEGAASCEDSSVKKRPLHRVALKRDAYSEERIFHLHDIVRLQTCIPSVIIENMSEDKVANLFNSILKNLKKGKINRQLPSISIMDITDTLWDENKNSDVIAALINQKLTGTLFLKRIEKRLNNTTTVLTGNDFIEASREDYVGSKGKGTSGRTDITLRSPNYRIIIENKIQSGDSVGQLRKYIHHFEKEKVKWMEKAETLYCYLTLWGTEPSGKSLWGNDAPHSDSIIQQVLDENRLICISYRRDILEWLEEWEADSNGGIEEEYLRSAINQYKGAVIQMIHTDTVFGMIRQNCELIAALDKKDREMLTEITSRIENVLDKLDDLAELKKELEIKLKSSESSAYLAKKLRFTINQSALFDDFEEFCQECIRNLNPATYLGVICCADDTDKCYGIGYEFTNDTFDRKRKIGFMKGGKDGEYWEADKSETVIREKHNSAFLANDLYYRIENNKKSYRLE